MKKFFFKFQKIALSILMSAGFMYAIGNVNVTCSMLGYQPKPPKSLTQFNRFGNE